MSTIVKGQNLQCSYCFFQLYTIFFWQLATDTTNNYTTWDFTDFFNDEVTDALTVGCVTATRAISFVTTKPTAPFILLSFTILLIPSKYPHLLVHTSFTIISVKFTATFWTSTGVRVCIGFSLNTGSKLLSILSQILSYTEEV